VTMSLEYLETSIESTPGPMTPASFAHTPKVICSAGRRNVWTLLGWAIYVNIKQYQIVESKLSLFALESGPGGLLRTKGGIEVVDLFLIPS